MDLKGMFSICWPHCLPPLSVGNTDSLLATASLPALTWTRHRAGESDQKDEGGSESTLHSTERDATQAFAKYYSNVLPHLARVLLPLNPPPPTPFSSPHARMLRKDRYP